MPQVLRNVGRYEILGEVGRGGMAIVYLARQTDLGRNVALKELAAFHQSDPTFARRFVRESRLAASLSHPNIVTVHDYFEHSGVPYIAMEYIERGSLRPYVKDLGLAQVVGVLEGVLAALAHAETRAVVHRDLKPENLMLTADGRVKIADFGIAKATGGMSTSGMLTATGMTVGTPTYMAPEQAMALEIGPWTDLYSVGCMAYEMLGGRPPFTDGDTPMAILLQHVNTPPGPLRALDPSLDPALVDWVERLLVKDPKERTASAAEAWDELEEIVIAVVGPRWRREARLVDRGTDTDAPRPLTPAPFESELTPTPPEQVAPPAPETEEPAAAESVPSGEFESFRLEGPAPAAADAPARPVTEVMPDPALPETQEEALSATTGAADVPVAAGPVAEGPVVDVPLAEVPLAEPETSGSEAAKPPEEAASGAAVADADDQAVQPSGFLTFRGSPPVAPEPRPPLEELPPSADEDEPPVAEIPEPATPPAPEAAPAADDGHAATITPKRPVETPPRVEPVRRPRPAPQVLRRRRAALLAVVVGLCAVAGYVIAPSRSSKEGPPQLTKTAASAAVRLSYPSGFRPLRGDPALPGLDLADAVAVAPAGRRDVVIAAGRIDAAGPTLLPDSLAGRVGETADPARVRLGKLEALRYEELRPTGSRIALRLYAVPTSAGVVVVACGGPSAALRAMVSDCERTAATLELRGARAFAPGPSAGYATVVQGALRALGDRRRTALSRLRAARTPGGQATAAGLGANAYAAAAAALRDIEVSPYDRAANDSLRAALERARGAYSRLAAAARAKSRGRYHSARAAIGRAEDGVEKAVTNLKALGYATAS